MKNFNIINKKGIKLNTANTYVNDDINVGLSETDKDNLVAENIKKDVTILGVTGTHEGSSESSTSLNLAYSLTPPTDTSKIWLQCEEPQSVEVQNYLGECAVSNVANYGGIDNPTTSSDFHSVLFSTCYIGNNQIAIVGYNHIRIYDLTTRSYIADYTISVGTSSSYTNVICKDNILYFGFQRILYSFDLSTQTLETIYTTTSSYNIISYIHFYNDNVINLFMYPSNNNKWSYVYKFDIENKIATKICENTSNSYSNHRLIANGNIAIRANDYVYNFYYQSSYDYLGCWKYDLKSNSYSKLTSWNDFVVNTLGLSTFFTFSTIYDNERFIYITGGYSGINYDNIIKYDTVNDTIEILDNKLLKGKRSHFSLLVDGRVYIFGGQEDTSNNTFGRQNQIDYFDLSYPLPQNNVILTINNKTDKYLPLINTEKLKLNSNIASAYLGNADNLAEKVNAYYYQSQISNDTYSSVTFDKNTIISNFENITNAINNNGGMLGCAFGGDSENSNYNLMISTYNEGIVVLVIKENEPIMVGNIGSDGTFNESFGVTPCTWLEGDTNTITFDNSYELNTIINAGVTLSTPQELIDLGICTFVINQDNGGYWKGINCDDYVGI